MPRPIKVKKPRRKRSVLPLLLVVVALGGFIAASLTVLFPLTRITLSGQTRYSPEDFAQAMELSEQNINLFRADVDELVQQAEQDLPWVRVIGTMRQPPNTLRLEVEELRPAFAQQFGEQWWIIAENGRLLELTDEPPNDALHLRGRVLYEPRAGQSAQWEGAFTRPDDLHELIHALRSSSLWPSVTGLRIAGTIPDVIYQNRIRIRLGSEETLPYQFSLAEHVIEQLNSLNPNYRGVLDLGVDGQTPFSPMLGDWEP